MSPHDFITRWQAADLSERAACQSHFADLCSVLGQPKPSDVDPTGSWYAFEKGVDIADGKKGWADVWLKGKFGWEYKRKHRDLRAAYQQLPYLTAGFPEVLFEFGADAFGRIAFRQDHPDWKSKKELNA